MALSERSQERSGRVYVIGRVHVSRCLATATLGWVPSTQTSDQTLSQNCRLECAINNAGSPWSWASLHTSRVSSEGADRSTPTELSNGLSLASPLYRVKPSPWCHLRVAMLMHMRVHKGPGWRFGKAQRTWFWCFWGSPEELPRHMHRGGANHPPCKTGEDTNSLTRLGGIKRKYPLLRVQLLLSALPSTQRARDVWTANTHSPAPSRKESTQLHLLVW